MLPTASTGSGYNQGGAAGRVGKVRPSLEMMARQAIWPTPTARDADKGGPGQRYSSGGTGLTAAVRGRWPTPTATDYKGSPVRERCRDGRVRPPSDWKLPEAVQREQMLPTPTANRWDGLQSHGVNVVAGQLNPAWVEKLMGFPLGWTDI